MKKSSKGIKYTICGTDMCTLQNAADCLDADVLIPGKVLFKGKVVEIGDFAFYKNLHLRTVVIPEGVVSIGAAAFKGCANLRHIVLPQSLRTIGEGAFAECRNLKSIELPPTVTSIPAEAFEGCDKLESINLHDVRSFGPRAFADCTMLMDIAISPETELLHASSFEGSGYCCNRKNWSGDLKFLENWLIRTSAFRTYTIPLETKGLAADVFSDNACVIETENPEYSAWCNEFFAALEMPNASLPEPQPQYFIEDFPVKLSYDGTKEQWDRILKPRGKKSSHAIITTLDGTIDTYL